MRTPQTLLEATREFSDADKALAYFRDLRWPDGKIPCPKCGNLGHYFLATQRRWKCKGCGKQFSVKVGTVFEDSPLGLDKWLICVWLVVNAKNGISSCEIARSLGITQKSAWFMAHRVRLALKEGTFEKLGGHVEADETWIGPKAKNMHKSAKRAVHSMGGGMGKTMVMGFLERGGYVQTKIIVGNDTKKINSHVKERVEKGSFLYTDSLASYRGMGDWYKHFAVDHAVTYVDGVAHTNGLENYWSLLKRMIRGTYIAIAPFHLTAYLDEQAFRYNERRTNDGSRFRTATSQVEGKRITYRQLIGKELAAG